MSREATTDNGPHLRGEREEEWFSNRPFLLDTVHVFGLDLVPVYMEKG